MLPGTVALILAPPPPRNRARTLAHGEYVREILAHAGLPFQEIARDALREALEPGTVLLLVGDVALTGEEVDVVAGFVTGGGAAVGVGSTSGAASLFGVEQDLPAGAGGWAVGAPTLGEGYVRVTEPEHPAVSGLQSALHFFNGIGVRATEGRMLAAVADAHGRPTPRAAVVERCLGEGRTLLLAPDIPGSVVFIQQGRLVDQDGVSAPDGSAPLADGLLKADDGIVLDWDLDRVPVPGHSTAGFLHPVADELRALLLKAIFHVARATGSVLPLLWYYPDNRPALGHISHDTDANDPDLGARMLEVVQELGIQDTWCVIMPGYPPELYAALQEAGQEIALHFDALEMGAFSEFREENVRGQHGWLKAAARLTEIVSNKNHYTRWEGRLEFFEWCERLAIRAEQSRGPSKPGCLGFPFGTAHPWFPVRDDGTPIDVLEVGFQSQDLVVFAPAATGRAVVDACRACHGIAHFIFHPAHIAREGVAEALRGLIAYGRERGLDWWSCARISTWERARRMVSLSLRPDGETVCLEASSGADLPGATLLLLLPETGAVDLHGADARRVDRYGFAFLAITRDLAAGGSVAVRLTLDQGSPVEA
jgi:hypothetical protein